MAAGKIDFAADAAPTPPADLLKRISAAVAQRATLMTQRDALVEGCKQVNEDLELMETRTLPDLMIEAGMKDFTLSDGTAVAIAQEIYASIPKASSGQAFAWLREHNFGSIIKRLVGVQFGKGDDQIAAELSERLEKQFAGRLQVIDQEAVHPSTLKAFVKECLTDKIPIPETLFGVFKINRATIKEPTHHE
jgi:hypothetical protein